MIGGPLVMGDVPPDRIKSAEQKDVQTCQRAPQIAPVLAAHTQGRPSFCRGESKLRLRRHSGYQRSHLAPLYAHMEGDNQTPPSTGHLPWSTPTIARGRR